MPTVRWNIAASPDTDRSLRMLLASQGGGRKSDPSRLIEEAVRGHILKLTDAWRCRALGDNPQRFVS